MLSARHLLRRLAAILRVAALLVMVPAFAQAHAGHAHHTGAGHPAFGHAAVGHILNAAAQPDPAMQAAVVAAGDSASDRADCVACPGCCCAHVFVAAADGDGVRPDDLNGLRVAMGPETARPSAVPEALPEPPRPFA
ncbi:hypothetical protein FV222_23740 [Methylobacterium sp. WL103]|uniref:hypothetical protein n=1 Tax=unclassified Methylobacterium TaxID=2615210 RepID=UPI0011C842D0|nr:MULTISPECIES: hypothetical protein [unclassified Methylobacterium]TXM73959.1 hypothetical protein FV226_08020 [Methylobacterium sp. WL12]TXM92057.1 hypothetical protein FV222_23740 [Methylobacterium sp. WL103]